MNDGHTDAYPVDAVKRQWDAGALNKVWVGDITYPRIWEGWVYLATVIDAHSRRVIGWAIADHMRTDLIQDALTMAMVLCGDRPATVIFHNDRGTQGEFWRSSQQEVTDQLDQLLERSSFAGSVVELLGHPLEVVAAVYTHVGALIGDHVSAAHAVETSSPPASSAMR